MTLRESIRKRKRDRVRKIVKKVRNHFDALAPVYDQTSLLRVPYFRAIESLFVQDVKTQKVLSLLDVGTWTGTRGRGLAQATGASVVGCDLSFAMARQAKRSLGRFVQADMARLPFADSSVDGILCLFGAFSYLPTRSERVQALREFHRVLRPGGERGEYSKRALQNLVKLPLGSSGNTSFSIPVEGQQVPGFLHSFRTNELLQLLQRTGFGIKSLYFVGYSTGELKKGPLRSLRGQPFVIAERK